MGEKKLPAKAAKMTARHKNILTAKPYEKQTNWVEKKPPNENHCIWFKWLEIKRLYSQKHKET